MSPEGPRRRLHPTENVTGVSNLNIELGPKRLELLHDIVPAVTDVAVLINPENATPFETVSNGLEAAASTLGLKFRILRASTDADLDMAFANLTGERVGGLAISGDTFFLARSARLA